MTRDPYTIWTDLWLWLGMAHWLSIGKQLPPRWAAVAMGHQEPLTQEEKRDMAYFYQRIRSGL